MRTATLERAKELREYRKVAGEYLAAHPLCQATLMEYGIPEALAIARGRPCRGGVVVHRGMLRSFVPSAVEIHHRNKKHGKRLTDKRWFLAVSRVQHDYIESHLSDARGLGWSLDISADPDGRTPGGVQALTTEELMARMTGPRRTEFIGLPNL